MLVLFLIQGVGGIENGLVDGQAHSFASLGVEQAASHLYPVLYYVKFVA